VILGKSTWGVSWTWDARLTLTAIVFFVYLGYVALRRTTDDPIARANRAAGLGIVGAAQIPLVHISAVWWRGLHQPPSIIRPDGPAIQDPMMLVALVVGVITFTVVCVSLMVKRIELVQLDDRLDAAERAVDRPVTDEAVTACNLGGSA
jgi:heme exporter protein C